MHEMEYPTVALALYLDDHHLFRTLAMTTIQGCSTISDLPHDIVRIGEGGHQLMSSSSSSEEQNLLGILCLTLVMLFFSFQDFVQLCWSSSGVTHTGVQICSAGRMSFCLCNLCQLHSQIVIITITLWSFS